MRGGRSRTENVSQAVISAITISVINVSLWYFQMDVSGRKLGIYCNSTWYLTMTNSKQRWIL